MSDNLETAAAKLEEDVVKLHSALAADMKKKGIKESCDNKDQTIQELHDHFHSIIPKSDIPSFVTELLLEKSVNDICTNHSLPDATRAKSNKR